MGWHGLFLTGRDVTETIEQSFQQMNSGGSSFF
jgi:hypothetical protein